MASAIDPTLGGTLNNDAPGVLVSQAAMAAALTTARDEISALQASIAALRSTQLGDLPATLAGSARRVLQVNQAESGYQLTPPVGHPVPGQVLLGNADLTVVNGSTAQHIRAQSALTASRTVTLTTTNAFQGLTYVVQTAGIGATFSVTVAGLAGGATVTMSDNQTVTVLYSDVGWQLLSRVPITPLAAQQTTGSVLLVNSSTELSSGYVAPGVYRYDGSGYVYQPAAAPTILTRDISVAGTYTFPYTITAADLGRVLILLPNTDGLEVRVTSSLWPSNSNVGTDNYQNAIVSLYNRTASTIQFVASGSQGLFHPGTSTFTQTAYTLPAQSVTQVLHVENLWQILPPAKL